MQHLTKSVIVATLAGLILSGCGKGNGTAPAASGMNAVEVGVIEVTPRKLVVTTELPGRTSPYQVAEVRPQVSGIIQKRLFTEGGDVKAHEVLYQIDPSVYRATYMSADAAYQKAEANLNQAKITADRYAELVKTKAVSQQEFDNADTVYKQGLADLESAKAARETARINLNYTSVTAPISGRVGKSDVTPGALVVASQATALVKIQTLDPMYVDVTQSSVEWLKLKRSIEAGLLTTDDKKQAVVKLVLEDGRTYQETGILEFSDVSVDAATGMIGLRALFPNPKMDLLPGMYVRAVLEAGVNEQAITIPQKALQRTQKGEPLVLVVTKENKIDRRIIQVQELSGGEWLVTSGVEAGDLLVVEGAQKLRSPEMVVHPVPVATSQPNPNAPTASNVVAPATDSTAK
ncbi:MAG: efflux RND transporter periplasmic adaptor subunit [Burkholderiales bacterium]|jgi:membrane fusion protein (multidrug efflux system)|nr:efflux RND transporter periplasmic adaptor subunit [Burkholderiales bacterium]